MPGFPDCRRCCSLLPEALLFRFRLHRMFHLHKFQRHVPVFSAESSRKGSRLPAEYNPQEKMFRLCLPFQQHPGLLPVLHFPERSVRFRYLPEMQYRICFRLSPAIHTVPVYNPDFRQSMDNRRFPVPRKFRFRLYWHLTFLPDPAFLCPLRTLHRNRCPVYPASSSSQRSPHRCCCCCCYRVPLFRYLPLRYSLRSHRRGHRKHLLPYRLRSSR